MAFEHNQKMGPTSAFDESPASSPWCGTAREIVSDQVNVHQTAATDFTRRFGLGRARAVWMKSLLLIFMAGLWCLSLPAATHTNVYEFEKSIPKPGSIQWDLNHSRDKDRQELYRKHIFLPDVMGTNVPIAVGAYVTYQPNTVMVPAPSPTSPVRTLIKLFFIALLFVIAGGWLLRIFAPYEFTKLNQQYNPWALIPVAERNPTTKVRAEEQAFGEFLTTFRGGPSTAAQTSPVEMADPLGEFYARAKTLLLRQRKLLQDIGRETNDLVRQKMLANLYFDIGGLKGEAGVPAALPVWQVAAAVEGLLKQLVEKTRNVSPSTLRTVGGGLDLLDDLCAPGLKPDLLTERPFKFLVVDDDLISRQALSLSLKKVFSQPDLAVDGETALAQSAKQAYDAIFLDVQMPGMDGFELCTKIRKTEHNRNTPVVFVTGQSDFEARAKSTLSGGNDLMGKPFLIFEVTLKALALAVRGRLQSGAQKPLASLEQKRETVAAPAPVMFAPRPFHRSLAALHSPQTESSDDSVAAIAAFLERADANLGPLQELCQTIQQAESEELRQTLLVDGFMRINSLIIQTGAEVVHPAYQMCSVLEGLFRKLLEKSKYATPSALATITAAVDILKELCVPGLKADLALNPPVHMLVVDDDLVARRALVGALQTAFKKPESAENGEAALVLAAEKTFDVIFLDVQMPGMDGFEVCAKIRETGANHATPVVFVTGHDDFEARAQMSRTGGDDLMGKPVLTSEITVKALTFALRGRLHPRHDNGLPSPAAAINNS
jgi:CheY-like chemotaxis protein